MNGVSSHHDALRAGGFSSSAASPPRWLPRGLGLGGKGWAVREAEGGWWEEGWAAWEAAWAVLRWEEGCWGEEEEEEWWEEEEG